MPVGLTLYRWSTGGGPSGINAARPGKSEEERRERIVTAVKQKTPKPLANAVEYDAHPVLVLDNDDIQLTNWWLIHDALRGASAILDVPPTIIQLDTYGDPWGIVVHRNNATWSDPLGWHLITEPGPSLAFPLRPRCLH